MSTASDQPSFPLEAADCRTPFGNAAATTAALCAGRSTLTLQPVLGAAGGDAVPLATLPGRALDETAPPAWLPCLDSLVADIPPAPWGGLRHPVFVTSSNFGVGSLYGFVRDHNPGHLEFCTAFALVDALRTRFGWGGNVALVSHACVSAHVGLLQASRCVRAGWAERALVFSFDFISPFVAGGFHALKILNSALPAPYAARPVGSIGLGDGAAFAVVGPARPSAGFRLSAQSLHNEMQHFTANRADGSGFAAALAPVAAAARGRRLWLKGHGTGTLEAGRLEAEQMAALFPGSPLVSWKGGLGHTLGSCGLVELALAVAAISRGEAPGTVGSAPPHLAGNVAAAAFSTAPYDGAVLASNAFGGAHAAFLLTHA